MNMPDCEGFTKCTFFKEYMCNMPSTAALTQSNYCKNNYAACARYRVYAALGEPAVPSDLAPSESERADTIIAVGRD
jgi:hypothetical protein